MAAILAWLLLGMVVPIAGAATVGPDYDWQRALDSVEHAMKTHDDATALKAMQECWRRSRAIPALFGVRLSYELELWAELAATFPPARQGLLDQRDADDAAIAAEDDVADRPAPGADVNELFIEVASLDAALDNTAHTVALFRRLDRTMPHRAQFCFLAARDALVAHHDYELCLRYIGPPLAWLTREKRFIDDLLQRLPTVADEEHRRLYRDTDLLLKLLASTGQVSICETIGRDPDLIQLYPGWTAHVQHLVELNGLDLPGDQSHRGSNF